MAEDAHKAIDTLLQDLRQVCEQSKFLEMRKVDLCLALTSLVREVEGKEREEVEEAIAKARRKPAGLTETISNSLRAKVHSSLSVSEVRYWLEREGFDLSDYSQPLATISVTLGRLAKSGRVKATRKGRNVTYQWIGD